MNNNNERQTVVIENKTLRIAVSVVIAVATGCASYKFFEGKWHLPMSTARKMVECGKDIIEANNVIETAANVM